jgi:hypothetical protein
MPDTDKALPENSKENLDRKLDHAVEETFPTSDPVSVQITKGGAIDYDDAGNPLSQGGAEAPGYVAQATEALGSVASDAGEMTREAYEQGSQYARSALGSGPSATLMRLLSATLKLSGTTSRAGAWCGTTLLRTRC